jgi:hypothetical protein
MLGFLFRVKSGRGQKNVILYVLNKQRPPFPESGK